MLSWPSLLHRLCCQAADQEVLPQPEQQFSDTSEARAARASTTVRRGELSRARPVLGSRLCKITHYERKETKTFTFCDAREPRPPPGVELQCCPQMAAARGADGGVEFIPLPDRGMPWAPVAIRRGAGIAAWRPSWMCVACARSEDLAGFDLPPETGRECERCGGRTEWVLDRSTASVGCNVLVIAIVLRRHSARQRPAPRL